MKIFYALIDGAGIYGGVLHYSLVIAFMGSAFLIFLYLWNSKRLDMDEEPKYQMLKKEDDLEKENKNNE